MYQRLILRIPATHRYSELSRRYLSHNAKPIITPELKLQSRVYEDLKKLEISRNSTILLCVSGGCDSVAMMHLLQSIKETSQPELDLKVVNFNHKMRPESDQEAIFVEEWAKKYNMDFFLRVLPEDLRGAKFSQEVARTWRFDQSRQILESLPKEDNKECYIATAHHMEDQMETILLRLLRGVHITNFHGMLPKAGTVIRPLLNFQKQELKEYLQQQQLTWHEDVSNEGRDYQRNKVRLDLIPLMSSLAGSQGALQKRLLTLSRQSQLVKKQVDEQAILVANRLSSVSFRDYHALYYIPKVHDQSEAANEDAIEAAMENTATDRNADMHNNHSNLDDEEEAALPDSFAHLSPLILQTILFEWIYTKTGLHLEQNRLLEFTSFFQRPLNRSQPSVAITISGKWDLVRYKDEVRLVLRRKDKKFGIATANSGIPSSKSTWTSTVFGVQGVDVEDDRPPEMVELSHPSTVTVQVEAMVETIDDFMGGEETSMGEDVPGASESQDSSFPAPTTSSHNNEHHNDFASMNIVQHIQEVPWVSKFEFFVPVSKRRAVSNRAASKGEEEDGLEEQGIAYTIRTAERDDFFYHDSFRQGVKVKNLVNKLHAARPDLGLSSDRVLVMTAQIPSFAKKSNKKSKITQKNNHSSDSNSASKAEAQQDLNEDVDDLQELPESIVAVLVPGAAMYSMNYTRWLQQPHISATSVLMQVQVHASPEAKAVYTSAPSISSAPSSTSSSL